MSMMGYVTTPLPQDPANYAGVGLNMWNTMESGANRYDANQLQLANTQAGGLAAAGNYSGAQNYMLQHGYPGQAQFYGNLGQIIQNRQDESDKADVNIAVGQALARGDRQGAANALYNAGRFTEAQTLLTQGQNQQNTSLGQQAGAAAAKGDFDTAAKLAYQSGDAKTAAWYQQKAQEAKTQQQGVMLDTAQKLRRALASATTQDQYDSIHDTLVASGVPEAKVQQYRDFSKKDEHLAELDRHITVMGGNQPAAAQPLPKPETGYRWKIDPATKQPILDNTGQPVEEPVPGGGKDYQPDPAIVQAIRRGAVLPQEIVSPFKLEHQKLMSAVLAADTSDDKYNQTAAESSKKAFGRFSAMGADEKDTKSLNQLFGHIGDFSNSIEDLGPSNFSALNYFQNATSRGVGSDAVTTFLNWRDTVGGEYERLLKGGVPDVSSKKDYQDRASERGSKQQLTTTAADTAEAALARFKAATDPRYRQPLEFFNPESKAIASLTAQRWQENHPGADIRKKYHELSDYAPAVMNADGSVKYPAGKLYTPPAPAAAPAQAAPAQPQAPITATGPDGHKIMLQNGQWVPMQ